MTFKKTLLAVGIASVVAGNAAAAAFDLNSTTAPGTIAYASEVTATDAVTGNTITNNFGFGLSASQQRYVRYDLVNATFATALTNGDLDALTNPLNNSVIVDGGGVDDTFVIFQITAAAGGNANSDRLELSNVDLEFAGTSANATVRYSLYEFGAQAVNAGSDGRLATFTGNLATFSTKGVVTTVDANTSPGEIDVTTDNMEFTGAVDADTVQLGSFLFTETTASVFGADGAAFDITAAVTDSSVTIHGDFSAADAVYLASATGCTGTTVSATTGGLTATTATISGTGIVDATWYVCMDVDGETAVQKGAYMLDWAPTSAASYNVAGVLAQALAVLNKNSSEAAVTFGMTPGGTFSQYFRFINPTSADGEVFITLKNDQGASCRFSLGDVVNPWGVQLDAVLPADEVTSLISMNNLSAACAAGGDNPTFAVGAAANGDKLRVEVEGEFKDSMTTVYGTDGIIIDSLTTSTDGTTLFKLN